jgi:glycosyltransferase involved in cell wall biosynthesis
VQIFEEIFSSQISDCIEIVYVDDAMDMLSWKVALHYVNLHPAAITASRNRTPLGSYNNRINLLRMATGNAYAVTTEDSDVEVSLILKEITDYLESGYQKRFIVLHLNQRLRRLSNSVMKQINANAALLAGGIPGQELPMLSRNPLVCVTVHNYNYGRFLRQCLDSLINQTYRNIRIIFSDNASEDDSWVIANEFMEQYPQKFAITRNRMNMGSKNNIQNCEFHLEGDYYIQLCSDDRLATDCIEKCVSAFRANSDAAMLIFHRSIEDGEGKVSKEFPFFNCSFRAPAGAIADIYLMSSVNPSISQIMYNLKVGMPTVEKTLIDRWFSNRFRDFILSIEYPVLYISEPLMFHRIHGTNDNLDIAKNLVEVIGPYIANIEFELIVKDRHRSLKNTGKWVEKLASLALRYSFRAVIEDDIVLAERYYYLSLAISPQSKDSSTHLLINKAIDGTPQEKHDAREALKTLPSFHTRATSYEPPLDATPI